MKKLIFATVLSLTSLAAYSYPATINYPGNTTYLSNLDVLSLNSVENSSLQISTGYPGYISYNCSLIMRTKDTRSLQPFLSRVKVSLAGAFKQKPEMKGTIVWPLAQGGYLGGITIETLDGKSIASNIAAAYSDVQYPGVIGIYADVCHKIPTDSPDKRPVKTPA